MYYNHHVRNLRWKNKNQVQYVILQLSIMLKEKFAVSLIIQPFAERRMREKARQCEFPLRLDNRRHELIDPLISVTIIGVVQMSLH